MTLKPFPSQVFDRVAPLGLGSAHDDARHRTFHFRRFLVSSWVTSQSDNSEVFNLASKVTVQYEFAKVGRGHFAL